MGIPIQAAFARPFFWVYTCQHRRNSVVWNSRNTPGLGTWENGHKRIMAENWWQSWIMNLCESKNFRGSELYPDEEANDIVIKSFDWTKLRKFISKSSVLLIWSNFQIIWFTELGKTLEWSEFLRPEELDDIWQKFQADFITPRSPVFHPCNVVIYLRVSKTRLHEQFVHLQPPQVTLKASFCN